MEDANTNQPPPATSMLVPVLPWYKSAQFWAGVGEFMASVTCCALDAYVQSGGKLTSVGVVGIVSSVIRTYFHLKSPTVVTNIPALDKTVPHESA